MNAQLWSRLDNKSIRLTLLSWFKDNNINLKNYYDNIEKVSTYELNQLYVYLETHIN